MKAMILAAGVGSRLGSLTANKPKALVEVNGMCLLERLILKLNQQGIEEFMVNVHHFPDQIIQFLQERNQFGLNISISDERNALLDTGGAIRQAKDFFSGSEPVLVHNVDVISEVDVQALLAYHLQQQALVTLCIRNRETNRKLLFNDQLQLVGWRNLQTQTYKWVCEDMTQYEAFAFNGLYLVSTGFADHLAFDGRFSIIDAWLEMAQQHKIIGYKDVSDHWFDLGTAERIQQAGSYLSHLEN